MQSCKTYRNESNKRTICGALGMKLARDLNNVLNEVAENIGKDNAYAYCMSKELKERFKQMKKDFKKCKKINAKNELYFYAIENILNNKEG